MDEENMIERQPLSKAFHFVLQPVIQLKKNVLQLFHLKHLNVGSAFVEESITVNGCLSTLRLQ